MPATVCVTKTTPYRAKMADANAGPEGVRVMAVKVAFIIVSCPLLQLLELLFESLWFNAGRRNFRRR